MCQVYNKIYKIEMTFLRRTVCELFNFSQQQYVEEETSGFCYEKVLVATAAAYI